MSRIARGKSYVIFQMYTYRCSNKTDIHFIHRTMSLFTLYVVLFIVDNEKKNGYCPYYIINIIDYIIIKIFIVVKTNAYECYYYSIKMVNICWWHEKACQFYEHLDDYLFTRLIMPFIVKAA